ncbi:DUF4440 domain-containing protein [Lysobacter sp. CFH 32150]|uniref:DUF4440 domain-containing protein n=1 Tax=Lysobacter sp. CFH 32150 TaxID=2927128 RepID=UPI001FA6EEEA|nr:DUF4440 domain-containing protein [Lysobacter sp. CFH 32150]MCI4568905.1 c-type cytochrome [Lysobacter sp. CFH 32150]
MKLSVRLLLAALIVAVLAIAFIYSGIYNIGADDPHYRLVHSLLEVTRERSIEARSDEISVPDLNDKTRIRSGAGNYDAMCTGCHLAPGMPPTELSKGLYPPPPNLAKRAAQNPAEDFWVIKHGIKATAMPAWGKSMEDEYIWGMVAFLRSLPQLNAEQYRATVATSGGHSHGGGETGEPEHHDEHDEESSEPSHAARPEPEMHPHADGKQHLHDTSATGSPEAAAKALHAALSSGDAAQVQALLDPEVLILESGGAERSRAEYAAHHLQADVEFLRHAKYVVQRQTGDRLGDMAWVATESSIDGESNGQSVKLTSAETLVLRKSTDGWKVIHVHWSSRPRQDKHTH